MAQTMIANLHNLIMHSKLGKVFKSMNEVLDSHGEEIKANLDEIMKTYKPNNELEKMIRIRLIDHYKCYEEVLNILKSEDNFYISHVLQCSWFFENSNFDPQMFVDSVVPYMSYTTRLKVLKRYSKSLKNHKVAVIFFNSLRRRYGLNTALILLPACDEVFVKHILETISIQVSVPVLLSLFSNYPSVVINYLTHLLECTSSKKRVLRTFRLSSFDKIFVLLATREPHKFTVLMEKYHQSIPYLKLGKRSTKQFVRVGFDSIKNNVQVYKRILNWKFVVSCLSLDQISELQLAMLPKTAGEFFQTYSEYCEYVNLTTSLKSAISREILISNFRKAYNKPVTDYLDVISLDLAAKLPLEVKEKWVESIIPELDSPVKKIRYIIHLSSNKSLSLLKEMIEVQNEASVRSQIVNAMFQTVKINNDLELIGDICRYVVKRLRNDRNIIRENLISELSCFKQLIDVSDDSWESIEEIINLMRLNDELSGCLHEVIQIFSMQIYSKLRRNLPVDTYLEKLLKLSSDFYGYDLCKGTPYEKLCLLWFINNFPEKYKTPKESNKNEESSALPEKLFIRLCQWNTYHRNDRIDIPDWLKQLIEKLFYTEEYHYHKKSVLEALKKDESLKNEFYNKICLHYIDPSILTYKLHQHPEFIVNHVPEIMKKILSQFMISYRSFFKQAKLYPALDISHIISSFCIDFLKNKNVDCDDDVGIVPKKNSIRILSMMLPTHKFVEIISNFYPKQAVMDDYSDEGRELFHIQSEISVCLKYADSPSEILESLSKFAIGDYVKLIVGSLSSICLRIPEYKILPLIKQWLDCPVSLRKHFFRAYFRIAPISNTLEMLVGLFENEKNVSIRIVLFDHALRFFLKEPSSETFLVLKAVIEKLKSTDDDAINKLFNMENVPDEFISEYLQLLWDVVSLKNETQLKDNRNSIIIFIEPDVLWLLNEDFCDVLIKEVFAQNSMNLVLFAARYLLYSRGLEQMNRRIEKVMFGIGNLLKKWDDFDLIASNVFISRNTVSFLIDSLVRESFNISENAMPPFDLLQKIKSHLLNCLKENDIFEEILLIDMASFFLTTPDNSELMFHFSKFLEPLVDKFVEDYGSAVIDIIKSPITKVLGWKYSQESPWCQEQSRALENKQIQVSEILLNSTSNHCFILGLKILPTVIVSDIQKYKDLLNFIFQNRDPMVKLFANKLYKELSSSVKVE